MWFSKDIFSELDLDDDTDALSELKQTQLLQTGKGKKRKVEEEAGPAVQKQEVAAPSQDVNADEDNSDSDDDSSDDER
ncbi:pre-rRNA processing protein FTSJ3-like [Sinocyclocheilus grahami]|uniref:pre-rRNA processing protein FTSJ3-like n=1 Tax=Sinocyclocheilus grahami TaxID=75366 RepID=UPI0007AC68C5|nr:PREDICTED: pre-rRNA processing protein FTSJ3-like [Sinocyclocheilus grahami]